MRLIFGCLIAVGVLIVYDETMHNGRYRTEVGRMISHMMHVTWTR